MVLEAAGNTAGARAAAEQAAGLYERKGAAALAEKARSILGGRVQPVAPAPSEPPVVELDNACVRVGERVVAAIDREAWDEIDQLFAPDAVVESRRKIVGFTQNDLPSGDWSQVNRRILETGDVRLGLVVVAVRGERLALVRLKLGTADASPGAPHDEFLQLYGIDQDDRIALQIIFDVEDMDAALAELDAAHARFEEASRAALEAPDVELDNACVQMGNQLIAAVHREAWDEVVQLFAPNVSIESHRKIVGFPRATIPSVEWPDEMRRFLRSGMVRYHPEAVAVRGERLAVIRLKVGTADTSPGAPQDEMVQLLGLDEAGRIALEVSFDIEDIDAALAELDAEHARLEGLSPQTPRLENAASQAIERYSVHFAARDWDALAKVLADDIAIDDRRRVVNAGTRHGRDAEIVNLRATADAGFTSITSVTIATRGERLSLTRTAGHNRGSEEFLSDALGVLEIDSHNQITTIVIFDLDDFDAALAELDARYIAGEAAPYARTWSAITRAYARSIDTNSPRRRTG